MLLNKINNYLRVTAVYQPCGQFCLHVAFNLVMRYINNENDSKLVIIFHLLDVMDTFSNLTWHPCVCVCVCVCVMVH